MLIDPVELVKIKKSLVKRVLSLYPNAGLEYDDLYNEAGIYSILAIGKYKSDRGMTLSVFIYGFIRDYLRNYVNRKVVPSTFGTGEFKRVGLDVGDLVYGLPVVKGFTEQAEAVDILRELRETCDERDLEILDLMYKEEWRCTRVARRLGIAKTTVNRRVQKMRKKLLEIGY